MRRMPKGTQVKKHGLGWGAGRIYEYDDGTAAFVKRAELTQAFRVRIADITGFSQTRDNKSRMGLERTLNIFGNGSMLAPVSVNVASAIKIEEWFRSHPAFGQAARGAARDPAAGQTGSSENLIADERL
jgi:hypothetical protein